MVSNHPDLGPIATANGIPFYHLPITPETKIQHEARLLAALKRRTINIHHSFLPGFKGDKPYHQAYVRGVKLIGATAHYVTTDLDEGPGCTIAV
ncbi:hypothetical protein C7W93_05505 [Glaciimonas sp. PCH181]|nr:hypothetical protein C7W93_05505 [Glaciimonas sp. PCH181]